MATGSIIRIIAVNLYDALVWTNYPTYRAELEDGTVVVERTKTPFFTGARALIASGADPEALVTMRHKGADHDSFRPLRLRNAAGLSVRESNGQSIKAAKWTNRPEEALPRGCVSAPMPQVDVSGRVVALDGDGAKNTPLGA